MFLFCVFLLSGLFPSLLLLIPVGFAELLFGCGKRFAPCSYHCDTQVSIELLCWIIEYFILGKQNCRLAFCYGRKVLYRCLLRHIVSTRQLMKEWSFTNLRIDASAQPGPSTYYGLVADRLCCYRPWQ